jgi:hypothetical protein
VQARLAAALLLLACGCYAPSVPAGAPCDPAAPRCPGGQVCVPAAGGHVCGTPGAVDAPPGGDAPDPPPELAHVRPAPGWTAAIYRDFSARYDYVAADFVDGPETYSNQPDGMFVLRPPFAEALAVIAGRDVLELTASAFTAHDYGSHPPNTAGLPDHLRGGTFVPDLDGGGPALLLSSSSASSGDGTFRVTPMWAIASDRTTNNTRGILWDPTGRFDAIAAPEGYLGTMAGVVRRSTGSMGAPILAGDTKTMHLAGDDLLITRQLATSVQLLRITTGTHEEKPLVERSFIELADGPAPDPYLAWAILDSSLLVLVRPDGTLETVAESTDPAYHWQAAAAAAPPHALAGTAAAPIVYVLEGNRTRDLDRVIAIRTP